MNLTVQVATPRQILEFSCLAHCTPSPDKRLIEAEFYVRYCLEHGIPEGEHFELELLTPLWEHEHASRIHCHLNPHTGGRFVCWTGHIPSLAMAQLVFQRWCLGTAHTMVTGQDFVPLVGERGFDVFQETLAGSGIKVIED